uniref:Uncharacterized protein n=1 Tax=Spironucleus salmonicida TaxID=348837 RepID=V6LU43_9EUKA|eukprot:EST48130.1 Hypothetical protein SS50377_11730 [Spironucleus salmonicida]
MNSSIHPLTQLLSQIQQNLHVQTPRLRLRASWSGLMAPLRPFSATRPTTTLHNSVVVARRLRTWDSQLILGGARGELAWRILRYFCRSALALACCSAELVAAGCTLNWKRGRHCTCRLMLSSLDSSVACALTKRRSWLKAQVNLCCWVPSSSFRCVAQTISVGILVNTA